MKKNVLFTLLLLGAFMCSMLPNASAIVIADAAADYVEAAGGDTGILTALPTGWSYFYSTASSGGTEVALTPETAVGNAGNTGFAGIDAQFGTAAVLGTHTEDPVDNPDYQFEMFSDGFDGNPDNANVNSGNEAMVGVDLLLHPGREATEDEPPVPIDPVVIARYTIQAGDLSTGTSATIAGSFRDLAGRANTVTGNPSESVMVEVLHNGNSLFNATGGTTAAGTDGYLLQAAGTFNLTEVTLAVGDTIDFTVNNNGNFGGDETALQAIIDVEADVTVLFGDADNDLAVSGSDLLAVTNNFGNTGAPDGLLLGDADDDGAVSGSDLLAVTNNFGSTLGSGSLSTATVPEPGSIILLLGSVVALCASRRRGIETVQM